MENQIYTCVYASLTLKTVYYYSLGYRGQKMIICVATDINGNKINHKGIENATARTICCKDCLNWIKANYKLSYGN